ncbi:hypothetical protein, partial [Dyella sp.]|uniref:hypothetical protein n=1 Tax=Dyella sp. TaxID=1869338 RepID=UPI002FD9445A
WNTRSSTPLLDQRFIRVYRPDSDLDIAIELDLSATGSVDKSGGLLTWSLVEKCWAEEIHQLVGLTIDLNQYLKDFSLSDIPQNVRRSNILVFANGRYIEQGDGRLNP